LLVSSLCARRGFHVNTPGDGAELALGSEVAALDAASIAHGWKTVVQASFFGTLIHQEIVLYWAVSAGL
jgi:hypothetical protein